MLEAAQHLCEPPRLKDLTVIDPQESEKSVYAELVAAAQRLARAAERGGADPGPQNSRGNRRPSTEIARLEERLASLTEATSTDVALLATQAIEAATGLRNRLQNSFDGLKAERSDPEQRRRDFANTLAAYDWAVGHRERHDFLGPFGFVNTPASAKTPLGKTKVCTLAYPSAAEVFGAVRELRQQLEARALALWPQIKATLLPLQEGATGLTWAQIVAALGSSETPARKVDDEAVLFALVWLRHGSLEPGWHVSTSAPALAQQKDSVQLPRIDKPGSPDKVYRFFLDGRVDADSGERLLGG